VLLLLPSFGGLARAKTSIVHTVFRKNHQASQANSASYPQQDGK